MEYEVLSKLYERLNSASGRLDKAFLIYEHISSTKDPEDLRRSILLLQGRIFPGWDRKEIGVSIKLVIKAISASTGASLKEIEERWKSIGDLGDTAVDILSRKQQMSLFRQELTIKELLESLRNVAEIEGKGSSDMKVKMISKLLSQATPKEARYIVRIILEDMRTGASEGVIRDAITWASKDVKEVRKEDKGYILDMEENTDISEVKEAVEEAINLTNDLPLVAKVAREEGLKGLRKIQLEVGKPINLMLYPKAISTQEAFLALQSEGEKRLAFEYKYDGFRVQIHKENDSIRLFTRRLDDVTQRFPDVLKAVKDNIKAKVCILDGEVIGFDRKSKRYLPFQSISQRIRRKYDIEKMSEMFPVELNIFDILFLDGKNLIRTPFSERRALLEKITKEKDKVLRFSRQIITDDTKAADEFYKESLKAGFEGIMAKSLSAHYKPGRRMGQGFKIKPVMDELDLVITAAEWGTGKRASWLTSYTVSFLDEEGEFKEIGKVSSGLKEIANEEESLTYQHMTDLLSPLITQEDGKEIKVRPEVIIEVHYEEIQKSPTYSGGYALRFPRIVRLRDDKGIDEIADITQIDLLYRKQKREL